MKDGDENDDFIFRDQSNKLILGKRTHAQRARMRPESKVTSSNKDNKKSRGVSYDFNELINDYGRQVKMAKYQENRSAI